MHSKKWINEIDEITAAFREAFENLSAEELNRKPDPDTWSIAQNIDHLIHINQSYYPTFEALKEGRYQPPWIGKLGFMVNFLGKFILQSVEPGRSKKMKTFPVWEPAKSDLPGDILDRFAKEQALLKEWIQSLERQLDNGAVISSPANRNIVYRLETAFDIIITHERRHLEQAKLVGS